VVLYSAHIVGTPGRPPADGGDDVRRTPRGGRVSPAVPEVEITFVSPAAHALLGCAPEDLLGPYEAWLRRVDPRDREIVQAAAMQVGRQRQPVTCEYRLAPDESAPPADTPSAHAPASVISLRGPVFRQRWV